MCGNRRWHRGSGIRQRPGDAPPGARAGGVFLPKDADWLEATEHLRQGFVKHPELDPTIGVRYSGYLERAAEEIERQRRHEDTRIPEGFDYAGNSHVDLGVWPDTRCAIVVNGSEELVTQAEPSQQAFTDAMEGDFN